MKSSAVSENHQQFTAWGAVPLLVLYGFVHSNYLKVSELERWVRKYPVQHHQLG